jgi:DNA-binding MarR family transcriptional regulator
MSHADEKWALARTIYETGYLLHQVHIKRAFAGMDPDSIPALTPPQVHMLMTVREHGCMTIKQLTKVLLVKAPAVSVMVDRLVDMGILTREENPADRREVLVRVGQKEESIIQKMEQLHLQVTVDICEKIGLEDARIWGSLCTRIQKALKGDPLE